MTGWQPTDPSAWKVIATGQGKAYSQFRQSDYKPPHRSPLNFALVKDLVVTDFMLEARVQSTARDYPHRDMCLFFGYQDPAHFYYAHLGQKADEHANQIFIVNGVKGASVRPRENAVRLRHVFAPSRLPGALDQLCSVVYGGRHGGGASLPILRDRAPERRCGRNRVRLPRVLRVRHHRGRRP